MALESAKAMSIFNQRAILNFAVGGSMSDDKADFIGPKVSCMTADGLRYGYFSALAVYGNDATVN